jgi:beta-galactosidase
MAREAFNTDWVCREPLGPFAAMQATDAATTPVTLPHDALRDAIRAPGVPSKGAGAYYPAGAFTYVKTFDVSADWAERVVSLEFQGAFRHAMVFVNDQLAGNRADGYARFLVNIKPFLRYGEQNEVRVEVRSGQDSRWYSGAGLHRPVFLHLNHPVHIALDGIRVSTVDLEPDQAVVEVATSVVNEGLNTHTATLTTAIRDSDGVEVESDETPVTIAPGETCLVRQRMYLTAPAPWSVDSPSLHTAHSTLDASAAEIVTTFGVRKLQVDPRKGLRINGAPVLLRGACIHHDNGPLGSAAIDRAEERRIELLKAAGFNAIRAAHNPMSPAMLDACDRLGMLVMDEAFDMWVRGKTPYDYALDFSQWWAADLESLVAKDYNHPSVIMYSLGNEIVEVGTPHGARLARQMAEHIRHHDSTRIVTSGVNAALSIIDEVPAMMAEGGLNEMMADLGDAMNQLGMGENVTRRTAESSSVLDVLGLNYAEGRYAQDQELFPHRVIVGSETFPSRIGTLWPMVVDNPNVIGDFTWTGWDYLGEVGIGATAYAEDVDAVPALEREFPFLTAWCGDIDITGHRRPISYYRELVFGLRSQPYLAVRRPEHHDHTITLQSPWAWSDSVSSWTWPGFEGKPVTVEVYADADEVALRVNGAEVARGPVGGTKPMLAVLETTYQPGQLVAVAYRQGAEAGRCSLESAFGEILLTATSDRDELRTDDTDLAFVTIEFQDAQGRVFTSADRPVTVEVSGAGVLAGMCSANPKTPEPFGSATWTTFDGRALAVIRPTAVGSITVTVTADMTAPAVVLLRAGTAGSH